MTFSINPDLQRFLDRLTSRSVLSEEERQAVLNLPSHAEQVRSNRDFVPLGVEVDHACLLVAGLVGRFGQNAEGNRQITAIHVPGDMADLHSVVQPTACSALQALSVATILRIPHSAIRTVAARYPAIAEALWRDCMVDATILAQWVVNVGRRDARERVAHLICEMAIRLRGSPRRTDILFDFPITQTQLADATGLTSVHINRTLQTLRHDGIVEWSRGNVVRIPEWEALAAAGDFDPDYLQTQVRPQKRLQPVEVAGSERSTQRIH
jgi:CRP-like cAMP-binding protein